MGRGYMEQCSRISHLVCVLIVAILALTLEAPAQAQATYRIENSWLTDRAINIETGAVEASTAPDIWWSAQWEIIPFADSGELRRKWPAVPDPLNNGVFLRNKWTGAYLTGKATSLVPPEVKLYMTPYPNVTRQIDAVGDLVDGLRLWVLEPVAGYPGNYRIRWAQFSEYYLHMEPQRLVLDTIKPNWQSALWKIPGFALADYASLNGAARAELQNRETIAARAEAARTVQAQLQQSMTAASLGIPNKLAADANAREADASSRAQTLVTGVSQNATSALGNDNDRPIRGQSVSNSHDFAIDFCHGSLAQTGTSNTLTVEFLDRNGNVLHISTVNGSGTCSALGAPVSPDLHVTWNVADEEASAARIYTNGDDAFFIDLVSFYRNGVTLVRQGRSDGGGWCLSTDPGDAAGAWAGYVEGCASSITFDRYQP